MADARIEFAFTGRGGRPTAGAAGAPPTPAGERPISTNPRVDERERGRIARGGPAGGTGRAGEEERVSRVAATFDLGKVIRRAAAALGVVTAVRAGQRLISSRIEQIAEISPEVALAKASNELADFDRRRQLAADLGPALGRAEEVRGAFDRVKASAGDNILREADRFLNLGGNEGGGGRTLLDDLADPEVTTILGFNFGGFILNAAAQALQRELDRQPELPRLFEIPEPLLPNQGPFAGGRGVEGSVELLPLPAFQVE